MQPAERNCKVQQQFANILKHTNVSSPQSVIYAQFLFTVRNAQENIN